MKSFLRGLFNFVWILLVGIPMAIANAVAGVVRCVTLIFIPFGIQNFKFIKLVFAPAGKRVIKHFSSHPVMNILWFVFGGFLTWLLNVLMGLIFFCTLIGIPVGLQLFKLAAFQLAPFGAEIVKEGEYTKKQDTWYDFKILQKKIYADPSAVIRVGEDGKPYTAADYIRENAKELTSAEGEVHNGVKKLIIGMIVLVLFVPLPLPYIIIPIAYRSTVRKPLLEVFRHYYKALIPYYPDHAKMKKFKAKKGFAALILEKTASEAK